jgi:hypothetical protein
VFTASFTALFFLVSDISPIALPLGTWQGFSLRLLGWHPEHLNSKICYFTILTNLTLKLSSNRALHSLLYLNYIWKSIPAFEFHIALWNVELWQIVTDFNHYLVHCFSKREGEN